MSVKDSVAGVTKQIVAEIVGDGRLAEEGVRQTAAGSPPSSPPGASNTPPAPQSTPERNEPAPNQEASVANGNRLAALLGHAVVKVWADLPRDSQELLFAAAVDDGVVANELAELLHDRHPRTAHPAKPTRIA